MRNSIVLHLFLLLIAFLLRFQDDPKQDIDTQYAVTVSFQEVDFRNTRSSNSNQSRSNSGAQREKTEAPRKIETTKPAKVEVPTPTPPKPVPQPQATEPQPTEPVLSETTTEESDIQAVEEAVEVEDPEPEYIPQESTDPVPAEEPVFVQNDDLPTLDDIIADITDDPIEMEKDPGSPSDTPGTGETSSNSSGTADSDPSLKDGHGGSGRADEGNGQGSDSAGDDGDSGKGDGGYGEGEFDASGDGIFGRKVIYQDRSMIRNASGKSGKIVFKVCINRRGLVSYVEINELETTIKDRKILRNAIDAMSNYKYEVDYSAPKEQCGYYKVTIDNFRGIRG